MNKKKRAQLISKILDEIIPKPYIPLVYNNPFTLLIAVLLSAQTTDECVNKVTKELFKRADTPKKMLTLSNSELERIITPCGLFRKKARAILHLSKTILEKFKGEIPSNLKDLESLEGVGRKTASVVLLFGFDKPAFPVDTHILRSAKRWGLCQKKSPSEVEHELKKLFLKKNWKKIHLQIILFAKKYCKAKNHKIEDCPICRALQPTQNKSLLI